MSASERLAALVRRIAAEGVGPGRTGIGDLISATPEIVAVVRAAETLIEWVQNDHVAYGDERTLRVALAALAAKLAEQ